MELDCEERSVWSPYTWFLILFTFIIVLFSVLSSNFKSSWYTSMRMPVGMIPARAFGIIWSILYIGMLIAIILAVWKTTEDPAKMTIIYVLLFLFTLAWVVLFNKRFGLLSIVCLLIIVVLAMLLIQQVPPGSIGTCNMFIKYFPLIMFVLFFLWTVIALYYNVSVTILNSSSVASGLACSTCSTESPTVNQQTQESNIVESTVITEVTTITVDHPFPRQLPSRSWQSVTTKSNLFGYFIPITLYRKIWLVSILISWWELSIDIEIVLKYLNVNTIFKVCR